MYCWYLDLDSLSLTTNAIAEVGMRDQPMIEKKLYQNRENACDWSDASSVSGRGLKEWRIYTSFWKFERIAFDIQLLIIGTIWSYLELTFIKNE